ncbi:MAG TPA: EamA family transporter [Anaerolineales bacterium]|nr:EamA family transporter [Anaerolineales bacterium]
MKFHKGTVLHYVGLHLLYFIYSWVIVLIKLSSFFPVFAAEYLIYLVCAVILLGAYAFFWQKAIRNVDLSLAYPQKGVVVLWTLLWSYLLWGEIVTPQNVVGSAVIVAGIALVASNHE